MKFVAIDWGTSSFRAWLIEHDQVCDWVLAPAGVDQAVEALAYNVAASLLTKLNYVGVLALEFFYGPAGLQVNEIAPRESDVGLAMVGPTSPKVLERSAVAESTGVPLRTVSTKFFDAAR